MCLLQVSYKKICKMKMALFHGEHATCIFYRNITIFLIHNSDNKIKGQTLRTAIVSMIEDSRKTVPSPMACLCKYTLPWYSKILIDFG